MELLERMAHQPVVDAPELRHHVGLAIEIEVGSAWHGGASGTFQHAADQLVTNAGRIVGSHFAAGEHIDEVDKGISVGRILEPSTRQKAVAHAARGHRHDFERRGLPTSDGIALRYRTEKRVDAHTPFDLRVAASTVTLCVSVRPCDEARHTDPGSRKTMATCKAVEDRVVEAFAQRAEVDFEALRAQSVRALEQRKQHQDLFERADTQLPVGAEQRVRTRVCDAFTTKHLDEVVDARSRGLQTIVLRRGDVPRKHVERTTILREHRRDLLRQKEVRSCDQLEATGNRVVVGERDEIHATRFAQSILSGGRGEAFGTPEGSRIPLVVYGRGG
ncbi:MAG: hypothetical protein ABI467_03485 [Kofleriaceae bacterium]